MQSKLPLLPSGPGGVCLSAFRGPWHRSLWASPARASSGRCVRQARDLLAAQSQRFPRSHRHSVFTPTPAATAELTHCVSAKPTAGLLCGFFLQTSNHPDSSQRRVHGPHGPRGPGGLPGRSARGHGLPGPRSRVWILLRSLRRVLGPPTGRGGPVDALLPKGSRPTGRRQRNTDYRSKCGLPNMSGEPGAPRGLFAHGARIAPTRWHQPWQVPGRAPRLFSRRSDCARYRSGARRSRRWAETAPLLQRQ